MYKNYIKGRFESVDFTINDAGTDQFSIRLDRVLDFLFSDIELYSDAARTIALSAADWEYYTEDDVYTAIEAEAGGSGKTVYSEIKILNATYQTGVVYATCNNFGAYTSGQSEGVDYIEVTADYAYEIQPNIKSAILYIPSTVTTQLTLTITQGTHPCGNANRSNVCRVVDDSGYSGHHIISDGDGSPTLYWVENQGVDFCYIGTSLIWASAGWETVYANELNTSPVTEAMLVRLVINDQLYKLVNKLSGQYQTSEIKIIDRSVLNYSASLDSGGTIFRWSAGAPGQFDSNNASYDNFVYIYLYHNGA